MRLGGRLCGSRRWAERLTGWGGRWGVGINRCRWPTEGDIKQVRERGREEWIDSMRKRRQRKEDGNIFILFIYSIHSFI